MALPVPAPTANPLPRFAEVAASLGMRREEQARFLGLSRSSYFRYLKAQEVEPGVAALAEFLPSAYDRLIELFGSAEDARVWLTQPNLALGRTRPVDLLRSLKGYEAVLETAARGVYGVY
ncbi:antitoxin Xre/MbcA/ParS toxin-binding domain-containing protein [Oceanithermus sp.]